MYLYHGYALGVASTIPKKEFTEASCALSLRGGKAEAQRRNFSRHGISFKSAESQVSGWWESHKGLDVWMTEARVIIQGLKILGTVTAERIEGHIYSEFRTGDYEASTVVSDSKFKGLKIAGKPVQLKTCEDLSKAYPTYSSMQAAYQNSFSQATVLDCIVGRGFDPEEKLTSLDLLDHPDLGNAPDLRNAYEGYRQQKALTSLKSAVVCSFVNEVTIPDGGDIKTWGPMIAVPDFGNIYLGEVIVWPWMRCLNMFRIELYSSKSYPVGSSISGGSAGVNGTTQPPGGHPSTSGSGFLPQSSASS